MAREERQIREEQAKGRPRKRRRRRRISPQAFPVLIALALIVLVGGFMTGKFLYNKYSPSKEMMDGNEYFGLSDDDSMAVIMNNELLEDKAKFIDGRVYLNVETVYQYINSRFYWDSTENLYLYALPTELVSVGVGSTDYTVAKATNSEDYVILRADGSDAYVALDFIKEYTAFNYEYWEEPNRVHVITEFGSKDVVTAQKASAVRNKAGIKCPILTKVNKGDTMYVLDESEEIDEWTRVLTADGYIGYIKDKRISAVTKTEIAAPEFEEPVYSNISKDYKINLTWHMVTNQAANDQLLNKVADAKGLNTISPTWFSIADTDGNISSLASQSYVTYAHQNGLEVWGLVDNFKEGVSTYETLSRTSSRQRLVNQLIAAAIQYGLDGINVDFETITTECSRAYIEFIRELSIMCRINGIVLSVDNYVPTSSSDHYDRAEQGVVADYVIIMGYDEHYAGSEEAGSVASHDFVERGITRTLEEVPKEKVINAVPFYTRFWKTDPDGTVSSEALGMNAADEKVANNNAEKIWDDTTKQYYVEIDYNGSLYQMWMEEETSIEDKMQLIKQYDLAGVASWRLGYERASIWDVILKYVN